MAKFTESIKNMRQHGDAVRIASIVNEARVLDGKKKISPAYVRSMLNENRSMTEEVKEVAKRYYEAQQELTKPALA